MLAPTLMLAALTGCQAPPDEKENEAETAADARSPDDGDPDDGGPDDDGDVVPDASRSDDSGSAEDGSRADELCTEQQGYVGEPATPGTMGARVSNGTVPLGLSPAPGPVMLRLDEPTDIRAETADGRTIDCSQSGRYRCRDQAGLVSVTVMLGEQSWTKSVPTFLNGEVLICPLYPPEDFVHFWLDDIARCIGPDSVVLEGTLLGYDPESAPPVDVVLIGERLGYSYLVDTDLENMGDVPYRHCQVSDNQYTCTTIGYRRDVEHQLRIQVGDHVVVEKFSLTVDQCRAETLQANIRACPAAPSPLRVNVDIFADPLPPLTVSASYDGGASYPCVEASATQGASSRFLCPAALESSHGAGIYEIVATGTNRLLRATYTRVYDGCTTSDGPAVLSDVESMGLDAGMALP